MKLNPIFLRSFRGRLLAATATVALGLSGLHAQTAGWQEAVKAAAHSAPDARILVLDVATNRIVAAHQLGAAARTLAAPGSTLKPLVLYSLITAGQWNHVQRVECNRKLVIAGHRLACPHPLAPPFDAREALTWSCNTYFAHVAETLQLGELGQMLRRTGLLRATGLARNEATAEFREPHSTAEEELAVLGVVGVRVTPLELAEAYRWLALEMAAHPQSQAAQVVGSGLRDSAAYGMADEVHLAGVRVAGKTGTAEDSDSSRTHGWFVGLAPADKPQVIVTVFVPAGRGADAAHVAGVLLKHAPVGHL
ncbi:MAG TPA: penicillin-binding transpeptidase domain-containing protein [Terracidiphilus sp.]|nr:penicillin-binding transpeptidase domain-containing protein [Terracidiphilus sp.]